MERLPAGEKKELNRQLVTLAIPIILQNIVNMSLSLLDTFMVGALGEAELSGVTLANSLFFVLSLFVFGIQSGSSVLISQYWGRGDTATINRVMGLGMYCAGAVSLIAALAFTFFPVQILSITSNDPELVRIAAEYARIVAFSYFLNSFVLLYIGAQRSMENPRLGMAVLMISMALNTVLNYALIFGKFGAPAMGVAGAALATFISQVVEFLITLGFALYDTHFRLQFSKLLMPGRAIVGDFIRFCAPVVANETLWGIGFSLYPIIIGHMDNSSSGVAAFTMAQSIERLSSCFYFGVGHAAAIIIGKRLGGGQADLAYPAAKRLCFTSFFSGIGAGALLALLVLTVIGPFVLPLFRASEDTVRLAKTMLYITCLAVPARGVNFTIIVGILRGGGDVNAGMLIDIVSMLCVAVPVAAAVGLVLSGGVVGVYIVMCVEEIWKFFASVWRFRTKKWVRDVTREMA